MSKDAQILKGWSSIVNPDTIRPGMNMNSIEEVEKQLISGGLIQKTKDPQDKFNDELKSLAKQFGINFGDATSTATSTATADTTTTTSPQHPPHSAHNTTADEVAAKTTYDDDDDGYDDDGYDDSDSMPITPTSGGDSVTPDTFSRGSELDYKTREQERRLHINSVMRDIAPDGHSGGFNFEEEKREDSKCHMLEEIDSLIYSLQDAEVDLSRIPRVDFKSSYEDIEMVLKILRHKSDRTRYCNLAEEFFIWGAYGMEELFDGNRVWFGRYQPCLTGWHTQVQSKLRRMRHDTSQLVSEVMHDYNIGPGMRVLLELIPNMFVYSSEKRKNQTQSMYSDAEMAAANERLRQLN